jgi:hypothetical protein
MERYPVFPTNCGDSDQAGVVGISGSASATAELFPVAAKRITAKGLIGFVKVELGC